MTCNHPKVNGQCLTCLAQSLLKKPITQPQKLEQLYGNLETAERFELLKVGVKKLDEEIEGFLGMKTLNEPQQAVLVSLLDRKKIRQDKINSAEIESSNSARKKIMDFINDFESVDLINYKYENKNGKSF